MERLCGAYGIFRCKGDPSSCSYRQLAGTTGMQAAGAEPSPIRSSLWRSRMGDRRLGQRSWRGSSRMPQEGAPPSDCFAALASPKATIASHAT
jgi:hypothetical protein